MRSVNVYLARFRDLVPTDQPVKLAVVEILEQNFNVTLKASQIKIERGRIYLQISPVLRNLIFLNQEKIVASLTEKLGKQKISIR